MSRLFPYLYWTSIYFFLLVLVYRFLVKDKISPAFSRTFILAGLMLSLAVGLGFLLRVPLTIALEGPEVMTLPEVVVFASRGLENTGSAFTQSFFAVKGLRTLYLTIGAFLMMRFLGSLIFLLGMRGFLKGQRISGLLVIPLKGNRAPFSFFNTVFIPPGMLNQPSLQQVLIHEKAHSQKLHSMDLVFTEIITVIFWFHPAIWYLRRELKLQHEYEADRFVVSCTDKTEYQQLLLEFFFRKDGFSITNSFSFSPLKKRIMMMNTNTKRSNIRTILSISVSAAFFAGLFLLQAVGLQASQPKVGQHESSHVNGLPLSLLPDASPQAPEANPTPPPQRQGESKDHFFVVVEEPPVFPGGDEAQIKFLQENLRYPEEARAAGIEGKVYVSFVVEADGSISNAKVLNRIGGGCEEEALRVMQYMPPWIPGRQRGINVRVQLILPINFVLDNQNGEKIDSRPADMTFRMDDKEVVFFIDGKKVDLESGSLNDIINPEEIENITVYMGEKSRDLYGYDNVIVIIRKKPIEE